MGLITSELVSNSYDHAFPGGQGTINVSLLQSGSGNEGTMVVADDGIGFTEPGDSKRHGLGLIRRLMQQIGGTASLRSNRGTEWTLRFPVPPIPPR